ncbi:MAG TPA: HAMP domain-containing sensor histidine kinase [Streptosporangiaceae bacterium]
MTRRIFWTFLALIAVLLVLAVVPLGLSMASNERASFRYGTENSARLVSSAAEELLGDQDSPAPMNRAIAAAAAQGDCAGVYGSAGILVDSTACRQASGAATRAMAGPVLAGAGLVEAQHGDWLVAAVPVGASGGIYGAVVFARSADSLNDQITARWGWLSLIGILALALGAALAVWLARWVSRPLAALGQAAGHLGEGSLDARAPADQGPQEVRELAGTFNRMAARTEALVHGHRAWVADVSHQLRTPLAALRLRLDLLTGDVDEIAAAELGGAQGEIARLSRLLDGLLAVARTEAAVPRPEPVRADRVASERVTAWDPVAAEREITLTAVPAGVVRAYLGHGELEQMLDNIVANALEAATDGGAVRIETSARSGRVSVRVTDNGPGMDQAAKDAALERFSRPGPHGNGLGLAIVSRLAAGNGGHLRLYDTPGGGLTVEIDLPAAPARHGSRKSLPVLNEF